MANPKVQQALTRAREISNEEDPTKRSTDTERFLVELEAMEVGDLSEVIAQLASYDTNPAAVLKALREGAIAVAEIKNTRSLTEAVQLLATRSQESARSIVNATRKFDDKAFWLTLMLIVLSVVGLLVAFIPDSRKEGILEWTAGLLHFI